MKHSALKGWSTRNLNPHTHITLAIFLSMRTQPASVESGRFYCHNKKFQHVIPELLHPVSPLVAGLTCIIQLALRQIRVPIFAVREKPVPVRA